MHSFTPSDGLHVVVGYPYDPGRPVVTTCEHRYENTVTTVVVPKGYRSDFASVPRLFWRLFPKFGPYARAALFHDKIYDDALATRAQADAIFLAIMQHDNVPLWQQWPMYLAVRWFGWVSWRRRHGRRRPRRQPGTRRKIFGLPVETWLLIVAAVCLLMAAVTARGQCSGPYCPIQPAPWRSAPPAQPPANITPNPAVVRVIASSPGGSGLGSGAIVSTEGGKSYVLTCWHVVADGRRFAVATSRGRFDATVVDGDRANDLAILETAALPTPPLRVDSGQPSGLLRIAGFGGQGLFREVSGPIVAYRTPEGATAPSLVVRTHVRQGDSGGPVLNRTGVVVGVVWGANPEGSFVTFGRPLANLMRRLRERIGSSDLVRVRPPVQSPAAKPAKPPAAAACECGPRWKEIDKRVGELDKLLASLNDETDRVDGLVAAARRAAEEAVNNPRLPEDLVRRGELEGAMGEQENRVMTHVGERIRKALGSLLERPGLPNWGATVGGAAAGLVGIGGSTGFALWLLGRRMGRRLERRDNIRLASSPARQQETAVQPIAVDSPPPPQQVVPQTHFVPYENDSYAKAHQWASDQIARKYPGSVETLTALDSLIEQQLNASPDS